MKRSKVIKAEEAAALIEDGSTVTVEGAGRLLLSESILSAIEKRFVETGRPRGLTLIQPSGFGDDGDAGASHFAHEGLVKRVISPGWGDGPKMERLALQNKVEAYCFPQGVVGQMIWSAANKKPRVITHVGLETFVDPRQEGGKMNRSTQEDLVDVMMIDGREWLAFKVFPIDVAIIRGTTADEFGNISMEHEAIILQPLTLAQAAKASGGIVLAEVKRMVPRRALNPQAVRVPGILVDGIVVNPDAWQIYEVERYNPACSGETQAPVPDLGSVALDARMVVARRAALELTPGAVINIGFGISDGVPVVAAQEGIIDQFTITIEQGTIGGIPLRGRALAAQLNPEAIIDQISQFNFYQGGGLDLAFLSFAELDGQGHVNVSKFGPKFPGCGGFIDISQNAKKVVFSGLFSKSEDVGIESGAVKVIQRGGLTKFKKKVEQITFNGARARRQEQPVLYVTERAVFGLGKNGVELLEIAPGCDLVKDILGCMEFQPEVSPDLKLMEAKIFCPVSLGIRDRWNGQNLSD